MQHVVTSHCVISPGALCFHMISNVLIMWSIGRISLILSGSDDEVIFTNLKKMKKCLVLRSCLLLSLLCICAHIYVEFKDFWLKIWMKAAPSYLTRHRSVAKTTSASSDAASTCCPGVKHHRKVSVCVYDLIQEIKSAFLETWIYERMCVIKLYKYTVRSWHFSTEFQLVWNPTRVLNIRSHSLSTWI